MLKDKIQAVGDGALAGAVMLAQDKTVLAAVTGLPSIVFFVLWILGIGTVVWYRKTKFKNGDAKSNWTAQIINALAQTCLLLDIAFA